MCCANTVTLIWQKTGKNKRFAHNTVFAWVKGQYTVTHEYVVSNPEIYSCIGSFMKPLRLLDKTCMRRDKIAKWFRAGAVGPDSLGSDPEAQTQFSASGWDFSLFVLQVPQMVIIPAIATLLGCWRNFQSEHLLNSRRWYTEHNDLLVRVGLR